MRQLCTALILGVAISTSPMTLRAQANTVERTTENIPTFVDINPCNGESVTLSGSVTTTVRISVDATGLTHEATTVLGRVEGLGASGAKYSLSFPEHLAETYIAGEDFPHHRNYTLMLHYIGQGKAPNFISRVTMHFWILADGSTKIDFEHVDERCINHH